MSHPFKKTWIILLFFLGMLCLATYYYSLQTRELILSAEGPTSTTNQPTLSPHNFFSSFAWRPITHSSLNVFFVETSCAFRNSISPGFLHLAKRQACAIYSTAFLNPKHRIIILHTCPLLHDYSERWKEDWPELFALENVYVIQTEISWLLSETPLASLLDGRLNQSAYPVEHSSDLIRLAVLYKYGGTYLDTDVISIRPLDDLGTDYIGAQEASILANGILNFKPNGIGHKFLEGILVTLQTTYQGSLWSSNGPDLVTDQLRKFCQLDRMQPLDKVGLLGCGIHIHPPTIFYPIPYWEWNLFLANNTWPLVNDRIKNTYILHFWNKLSGSTQVHVGSQQPYGLIAANYCSPIYFKSGDIF